MNKKGFTLVEVLLTLAILALLLLILVPNAFALIEKNNIKSCENLKKNIESSAKIYVNNNKHNLGFECGVKESITLQTLVDSGDLSLNSENKITNPVTDKEIDLNTFIEVTYDCIRKEFTYNVDNISCEKKDTPKDDENKDNSKDDENKNNDTSKDDEDKDNDTSNDDTDDSNNDKIESDSTVVAPKKITIIDNSSENCPTVIEYYYEDSNYKYYFRCSKSNYIHIIVNGETYNIKEALNSGVVTMSELEANGFIPLKESKNTEIK